MAQQTAVEWLVKEIESLITIETFQRWKVLKEQAKQMEKEQIIAANEDSSTNELGEFLTGEQYYNETYGNK